MNNKQIVTVEWNGERVITTAQLANIYETDVNNVQNNFNRNKERFVIGKHYYLLKGDELKAFKNQVTDGDLVNKHTTHVYLWTKRGASRHCKILDTEKSWEQFDCLEENYFNPKRIGVAYQYPVSQAAMESATNAGRLFERIMRREGISPHEIAMAVSSLFRQAGIDVPQYVVKIPEYEQIVLPLENQKE
ncbi:ORF6N domain-containing protein [bacterium D16-51]|nr:ORF6N domain-containing protein [bacterium D16-59]RKI53931.1 ORF6N domain-containing protein [bacterium D16-51]